jgi:outer membrane lipoprotein-sorting protein
MRPSGLGAGIAYAEVQQAIRNIQTAIVDFEHPYQPHHNRRAFFRRDMSTVRVEYPNGFVWVSDGEQGRCLVMDELERVAQVVPAYREEFSAAEHLGEMASLDRDALEPVGKRMVDGRTLFGFRVKQPNTAERQSDTIWVDAETRLPAIREHTAAETEHVKGYSFRQIYTFNKPLAPELFNMTPPDGYQLVSSEAPSIGRLPKPALPAKELASGPTLKPLIGIGEVTFGMTVAQIVKVLGKADRITHTRKYTPEESRLIDEAYQKARHLDKFEGQQLIDETEDKVGEMMRQRNAAPEAARLEYDRLGIELIVSLEEGFRGGFCWNHGHGNNLPYAGQTTEGIGIGSTLSEVEEAYGQADGALKRKIWNRAKELGAVLLLGQVDAINQERKSAGLWYKSRGLHFRVDDGKVRYIVFNRGPESR